MENVLLVVHLLACIALIIVVLLQRSEGGALGIGGGGGGGLMSGRGAANALTRATMIFAGIFIVTSLTLTSLYARKMDRPSAVEEILTDDPTVIDLGDDLAVPPPAGTTNTTDDLSVPDDTPNTPQ